MFFWLARAQDGFWLGFSKKLKNSWSRTHSLLRNSLTFDYQLFSISYFYAFPALSLSLYGCAYADLRAEFVSAWCWLQCWMLLVQHLWGSECVKSHPCHMEQGWCHPGKDAGTSDVSTGPAVRLAKCICWQMCSWPILRLTFPSHPLPSLMLCLFRVCLRPCVDSTGQQKDSKAGVRILLKTAFSMQMYHLQAPASQEQLLEAVFVFTGTAWGASLPSLSSKSTCTKWATIFENIGSYPISVLCFLIHNKMPNNTLSLHHETGGPKLQWWPQQRNLWWWQMYP